MSLTEWSQVADIVSGASTVGAIIVGGIWSYRLFIERRQKYPRATLTHQIRHWPLPDGRALLHAAVVITNVGDVLLSLASCETRVQQVLPLPDGVGKWPEHSQDATRKAPAEIEWPLLGLHESRWDKGTYEVEPGENHEFHHDFILPPGVETVQVYSYLRNEAKPGREIGWDSTALYDVSNQTETHPSTGR